MYSLYRLKLRSKREFGSDKLKSGVLLKRPPFCWLDWHQEGFLWYVAASWIHTVRLSTIRASCKAQVQRKGFRFSSEEAIINQHRSFYDMMDQ